MADISTYLQAIMSAVYGEDVRGSIHDAIEIINDVGEKILSCGTAVTSTSSSVEGYFDGSVYFNTQTNDVWKCTGTAWDLQGNIKGAQGEPGVSLEVAIDQTTGGHIIRIFDAAHPGGQGFFVPDGDGAAYISGHALVLT